MERPKPVDYNERKRELWVEAGDLFQWDTKKDPTTGQEIITDIKIEKGGNVHRENYEFERRDGTRGIYFLVKAPDMQMAMTEEDAKALWEQMRKVLFFP